MRASARAGLFFRADVERQDQMHRLHVARHDAADARGASEGWYERGKGGDYQRFLGGRILAVTREMFSYCATKCWMNSFTEGLALELKSAGSKVRMQALCPGYTRSEFHDAAGMDRKLIGDRWMAEMGADARDARGGTGMAIQAGRVRDEACAEVVDESDCGRQQKRLGAISYPEKIRGHDCHRFELGKSRKR